MSDLPPIENDLVEELRQKVTAAVEETGIENFDHRDISRMKTDDLWLWRFIVHQRKDINWAFDMMMECIKWRKEFGVNDIKAEEFPQFLDEIGALYVCNKDKDGHRLVIMHVRRYRKEPIIAKMIKRYFIHYMEKLEKEDAENKITIIFDMQGAGLANVDMDFLFFMFSCFKTYYPSSVALILAFDMPWIFSAMWKIVKSWLSAGAANKIKFVNKKTILEYVDPDQLLNEFGGNVPNADNQREAEKLSQRLMKMSSSDLAELVKSSERSEDVKKNNELIKSSENSEDVKKDELIMPSKNSVDVKKEATESCQKIQQTDSGNIIGDRAIANMNVSPLNVEFHNGAAVITITNLNRSNAVIAYKVKTTSPEKFRVRPSQGIVRCNSATKVAFTLLSGQFIDQFDKFIVIGMDLGDERRAILNQEELKQKWNSCSKQNRTEFKLKCVAPIVQKQLSTTSMTGEKAVNRVSMTEMLLEEGANISRELRSFGKLLRVVIVVQLVLAILIFYYQLNLMNYDNLSVCK
ncbi:Motile sperm domain-containing protein 2 [Chamberlinius hualienensis]